MSSEHRFKVIADWPGRKDFEVGQIVTLAEDFPANGWKKMEITDCQGTRTYITSFFEMFPHLFKRLEWWEELDELPDFVKNRAGEVFMCHKKDPKGPRVLIENLTVSQHFEFLETLSPATAKEYKDHKENPNQ